MSAASAIRATAASLYKFLEQTASDYMTRNVACVPPTLSVRELGQRRQVESPRIVKRGVAVAQGIRIVIAITGAKQLTRPSAKLK